jgi:hypothetical protein
MVTHSTRSSSSTLTRSSRSTEPTPASATNSVLVAVTCCTSVGGGSRSFACLFWCLLTREEDYAYAQPSLTRKKLRRLELTAGASRYTPKAAGIWSANDAVRQADARVCPEGEARAGGACGSFAWKPQALRRQAGVWCSDRRPL